MVMKRTVSNTVERREGVQPSDEGGSSTALVSLRSSEILPADQHPVATYLAGLAPGSRRVMRSSLRVVMYALAAPAGERELETFPWTQLRHQHVSAVRQLLVDSGRAPSTSNRILAALRGVIRECWRLGYVDGDTYQRAIDVPPVHGTRLPRGRALETKELAALFTSCRQDPDPYRGARDAALLALLFGAGLRRAEAVGLQLEDVRTSGVRVLGKGDRERLVPIPPNARLVVMRWIHMRGGSPGPLFLPLDELAISPDRMLTAQAIYMILRRRASWAGVASFSPHDLRRSYVSALLDAGVDLHQVSQLAGHAQVQTTARYDRRKQASLAEAVKRLRVPV